jgi:hypothetical protein
MDDGRHGFIRRRSRIEKHSLDIIDSVPALISTARHDGYSDYFDQPWFDYVGLPKTESHKAKMDG